MSNLLGLHVLTPGGTVDWARRMAAAGRPFPVIKICDPQAERGALRAYREASPKSTLMIRVTGEPENIATEHLEDCTPAECYARGGRLMQTLDGILGDLVRQTHVIEIMNEPDPPGEVGYQNLGRLLMACIQWASVNWPGVVLAMPGLNRGTPQPEQLRALLQVGLPQMMEAHGHIWTVHEGGPDRVVPLWTDAEWFALRHRTTQQIFRAAGVTLPIIVSECYLGGGYDVGDAAEVVARWAWYEQECARDNVLAVLPFTCGTASAWQDESYDALYPTSGGLMDYELYKEIAMPETNNGGVVLVHHFVSTDTMSELLKDAPAGAYRMEFSGDVKLTKLETEPPAPTTGPAWTMGGVAGMFWIAPPVGLRVTVYDKPATGSRATTFADGRRLDVLEIRPDGWMLVYRAHGVELWLPPLRVTSV